QHARYQFFAFPHVGILPLGLSGLPPWQLAAARRIVVMLRTVRTQKPPRLPSTARAVAFCREVRCVERRSNAVPLLIWTHCLNLRRLVRCQCVGPTIPDAI